MMILKLEFDGSRVSLHCTCCEPVQDDGIMAARQLNSDVVEHVQCHSLHKHCL